MWGPAEARRAGAQGRSARLHRVCSMGLCKGPARGSIVAQHGAVQEHSGWLRWGAACSCAGVQRGAAKGRSMRPLRGGAWGRAEAERGAAQGNSARLRRGRA